MLSANHINSIISGEMTLEYKIKSCADYIISACVNNNVLVGNLYKMNEADLLAKLYQCKELEASDAQENING